MTIDSRSHASGPRSTNGSSPHGGPVPSAREAALRVLNDCRGGRRPARELIEAVCECQELSSRQAGLITELVMGVIRHRLTLARVLSACSVRSWRRVGRQLQHILMLGAYQLIWLDGVPAFAAVNEAVEQAKVRGGPGAARFANAVLRQLLREIEHRRMPDEQAVAARAVPIDQKVSCQFRRPMLPDPGARPVEHLADSTSHPQWLVSRWAATFGLERTRRICRAGTLRPPLVLRPNLLRTDSGALAARLKREGFDAQLTPAGDAVVVGQMARMTQSSAFAEGWFQPQDRTAMEPVRQMALSPGQVVIDLCAGLGTKATQIAEAMNNSGIVLACDKDPAKLALVRANCARLGHTIVRPAGPSEVESLAGELDAVDWVLIDAPCSNTGVLARRPEARYRIDRGGLDSLTGLQRGLLHQASRLAESRPGPAGGHARLLYCTCSIEPEENEQVAEQFARAHPQWRLAASHRTFPSSGPAPVDWRDGGYWAIWVRE